MIVNLDTSDTSTVLVCGCGWRSIVPGPCSREPAHRLAVQHEVRSHPGEYHAREALSATARRRSAGKPSHWPRNSPSNSVNLTVCRET